jgi:hypothetical protein
MKKLILALVAAMFGLVALSGTASATGGHGDPPAENKKVTLCHATGSQTNPYTKITVSVSAFYQAGHVNHNGDIWEAFSYTTKSGQVVNVPARGDTSLLAFEDCKKPKTDEKITKPEDVFADKCGTKDDVFSVAPGRGYTVSPVAYEGNNQVITVTLEEGFAWAPDGNKQPLRFVRPPFTNEDCDLPETGLAASYNTPAGYASLGLIGLLGAGLITQTVRRRRVA